GIVNYDLNMNIQTDTLSHTTTCPDLRHGPAPSGPRVEVVASTDPESGRIFARPDSVGWLRVTAGAHVGHSPAQVRERLPGRLIYGCSGLDGTARLDRLRDAADHCELVELDANRDLTPDLLAVIPPGRRLISWRGATDSTSALAERFQRLEMVGARFY